MRPYVLHEFSSVTLPSGEPLTLQAGTSLPAGTIVSLVLESRDKFTSTDWYTCDTGVRIEDDALIQDLPAQTRSEELFFRVIEYLPKPRDRYVVQRVVETAHIYAPLSEGEGPTASGRRGGAEISIQLSSVELQNKYFPIDADSLYFAEEPLTKLRWKLRSGRISQEQFDEMKVPLKQAYVDVKSRLCQERDAKYPIGSSAKIRIEAYEESSLHGESVFLREGDRITCKRKNIHFVGDPRVRHNSLETIRPRFITSWEGTFLHPSVRKLVGRGHLVRAACVIMKSSGPQETVKYFSIADVLKDGYLLGILRGYYTSGWDDESLAFIGKYFIFHREAISEIPHTWPENESVRAAVENAKETIGLAVTGITAL